MNIYKPGQRGRSYPQRPGRGYSPWSKESSMDSTDVLQLRDGSVNLNSCQFRVVKLDLTENC